MSRPTRIRFLRFGGALAIVAVVIIALVVALQVPTSVTYAKKKKKTGCVANCYARFDANVEKYCPEGGTIVGEGGALTDTDDGHLLVTVDCVGYYEDQLDECLGRCGGATPK